MTSESDLILHYSRLLVLLGCLSLALVSCNASPPPAVRKIDLNVPGVMESLRATNPRHYEQIQEILKGLEKQKDVPKWMQSTFEAKNVSYSTIFLTTEPPQRNLSFVLEETLYHSVVTVEGSHVAIYPVKH